MRQIYLGRHVLGLSAVAFGVISFVWHDFGAPWQQIQVFGSAPHREILVYIAAAFELVGGIAIQWRKTARLGALLLGVIFLVFALLWVPRIIAEPRVYDRYGNFFEQFSIVSGALIVCGTCFERDGLEAVRTSAQDNRALASERVNESLPKIARIGYIFFCTCVISFLLEHVFYLRGVAAFTPKWIPPGQMFWAITTTICFALAAIALFSGRYALLASRLLTAMIVGFGLLVWLPKPFADPHQLINWAGNAQNDAIAGAAWIVADYLSHKRSVQAESESASPDSAEPEPE